MNKMVVDIVKLNGFISNSWIQVISNESKYLYYHRIINVYYILYKLIIILYKNQLEITLIIRFNF